jgi:hypothetical protein
MNITYSLTFFSTFLLVRPVLHAWRRYTSSMDFDLHRSKDDINLHRSRSEVNSF